VPIVMAVIAISVVMAPVIVWVVPSAIIISRSRYRDKRDSAKHQCKHLRKQIFHKVAPHL
jgi:heme/copper-type cytochrome/quinol oxidase subunit 2